MQYHQRAADDLVESVDHKVFVDAITAKLQTKLRLYRSQHE